MKPRTNPFLRAAALALISFVGTFHHAHALSATWDGDTNGNWNNNANWSAAFPNLSGEVATFNADVLNSTITLGTDITITSIKFDTANCEAYTFNNSANKFILGGSGDITVNSAVTTTQTINTNIQLGGNGGAATYNLVNNSTTALQSLIFGGSITGGSGSAGAKILAVSGAGNTSISGAITKGGASTITLTKTGNGTLTLSSASNVLDTLNANAGVVALSGSGTIGSATALAMGGGQFNLGGTTRSVGAVTITSAYASGDTISNGSLTGTSYAASNTSGTATVSAILGGASSTLAMNGSGGNLKLTNANTYGGTTTLTAGTVQIGSNSAGSVGAITSSAIGTGGLTFNGGTLSSDGTTARTILNAVTFTGNAILGNATNNGKLTFSAGINLNGGTNTNRTITLNSDVQFDGAFSNPGTAPTNAVTKAGSGTLTINASNSGVNFGNGNPSGFVISAGKVIASNIAAFGSAGQIVTLNGGTGTSAGSTVEFTTDTSPNAYVLNQNSGNNGTVILNRATSGTAVTYSMGTSTLGAGNILNVQKGGNVTDTPTLALSGLTLTAGSSGTTTLSPTSANISITGSVTGSGTANPKGLQLDGTSNGNLISGSISNGTAAPLSLTKANSGTWELSNANTFTGNTKVTGGTLKLTNNLAIQNSAFDTSGAGTLDIASINTPTFGGLTSSTNYSLPVNVTSLTLNVAATQTFTGNLGGGTNMQLIKAGTSTQILSGTNGFSGNTTINAGSLQISNSGALGSSTNILVNSGASGALVLAEPSAGAGLVAGSGKALTIKGTGVGTFYGALTNAVGTTGTTDWQGTVSIDENQTRIGAQGGTLKISGNISATSASHQLLVRNNGNYVTLLTGTNNYAGGTRIVVGELHVSGGSALNDSGLITLDNTAGVVFRTLGSESIGALTGGGTTGGKVVIDASQALSLSNGSLGTQIFAGVIEGSGALTVDGAAQTLTNQNTYSGGTNVASGTLNLGHAINTLANGGAVNVSGGTLALGTNSDTVGTVSLTGGSITSSGAGTLTGSGSNYDFRAGSVAAILGGTIGLDKTTGGTVDLSGVNAYTGATGITGGTLSMSGAGTVNTSSGITINGSGAKLVQASSVPVSPVVTLTQGTLTGSGTVDTVNVGAGTGGIISNNNGVPGAALTIGTLTLAGGANINLHSNSTAPGLVVSTLTNNSAAGAVTITANSAGGWTNGITYDLISYGTLNGTGLNNFAHAVNNLSARQSASWNDTGSALQITVTGTNPYWTGGSDNKWNLSTTNNWKLLSDNSTTTFLTTDDVLFDDNASGSGPIIIDIDLADVAPNTTVFNNNAKAYVLSSSGGYGISSGSLTKTNAGSLIISTANSYTGPTAVNGGNVTINGSGTLGSGSALSLGGGQLDLGGTSQVVGAVIIAAPAASGDTILNGSITGTSYAADNSSGNAVISANLLANGAAGFTKSGAGTVTLTGTNTWTGATAINGGSLVLSGSGAMANVATLTLGGGSLDLGGLGRTFGAVSVTAPANSGATISNGSLTGTSYEASNTTGNAIISANLLANGTIGFTKLGAGTVTLAGTNTYTGTTTVSAGTLAAGSSTAFTNLGALSMSGSATLDLNGFNAAFNGNVTSGVSTNTITDSSAGTGTSTITFTQTAATSVSTAALITDGTTRKVAFAFTNANGAQQFTNALNTFSGGITLLNNASAGTRLQIAVSPTTVGTAGAIVSSQYGKGAINVGQTATDKAGIYVSASNVALYNDVVANTGLGTDRVGTFRIDSTGNTFYGTMTAGASDFTLSTNGTGAVTLAGKVTGSNGLRLLSHSLGGTSMTVTLANTAGTNDYSGNTTINDNAQSGRSYMLVLGSNNQIPNGTGKGNVVINTNGTGLGTLRLQGFSDTINGLSGNGTVTTTVAGTSLLTLGDNDATSSFSGVISNTTGTVGIIKTGAGDQTFTNTSSYTGGTRIDAGKLILGHATDTLANTGAVNVNGGELALGTNTDTVGAVTLTSGSITGTGAGKLTGTGSNFDVRSGTISAKLGGTVGLDKTTGGLVTITSDNSTGGYTGTTTVSAGTLIVNGNISTSSLTTVQSGATLGGSGTLGDLTIEAGGFHNPGNSPGIMNIGDYTMAGTLNIEITGNTPGVGGYDQVNVVGTVNLSGALAPTFSPSTYANGDLLFILLNDSNDTITGTFSGLAQDSIVATYGGFDWKISYTANGDSIGSPSFSGGNDIALMAVPEPNVAALLGGLGTLALMRRRRSA